MKSKKKKFYTWPVNKELQAHMAMRKKQHIDKGMTKAEKWFFTEIAVFTPYKWTTQARWGFRLFDFWCHYLGCAVEIDGIEHDPVKDKERDSKEWDRSRIVILRIRKFNVHDSRIFLENIKQISPWNDRRRNAKMKEILNAGKQVDLDADRPR